MCFVLLHAADLDKLEGCMFGQNPLKISIGKVLANLSWAAVGPMFPHWAFLSFCYSNKWFMQKDDQHHEYGIALGINKPSQCE